MRLVDVGFPSRSGTHLPYRFQLLRSPGKGADWRQRNSSCQTLFDRSDDASWPCSVLVTADTLLVECLRHCVAVSLLGRRGSLLCAIGWLWTGHCAAAALVVLP